MLHQNILSKANKGSDRLRERQMLTTKCSDHKRGDRVKVRLYWFESEGNIVSR